jgi:hypothetical protein
VQLASNYQEYAEKGGVHSRAHVGMAVWADKADPVGLRMNRFGSSLDRFTGKPNRLALL